MQIAKLAYLCAALPVVSVHLTWAVASLFGNVQGCFVYWGYCHSISATGRQYPEFFIFKGLMIPAAMLMMAYWILLYRWLLNLKVQDVKAQRIKSLGLIACVALIIYCVTLGADGEPWALPRRIGVILYFSFTSFAHLLLLNSVSSHQIFQSLLKRYYQRLLNLCILLLILGVFSALLGFLWDDYNNWDNAFEWWFALLMVGTVCHRRANDAGYRVLH